MRSCVEHPNVLPVEMIDDVVGVEVERGDSVRFFRLATNEYSRPDNHRVSSTDESLAEMTTIEHSRTGPHNDDFHAVIGERPNRLSNGPRACDDWPEPSRVLTLSPLPAIASGIEATGGEVRGTVVLQTDLVGALHRRGTARMSVNR